MPQLDAPLAIMVPPTENTTSPVSGSQGSDTEKEDSPIGGDPSSDIIYHYLTFDTELVDLAATTDVPTPDLSPYVNPFEWPESRKTYMIVLSSISTLFTAYSAGCYSAGLDQFEAEWHIGRTTAYVGIAIFTAGFAVAPMVLAPFSEINGRRPVFVFSGIFFVIFQLLCGVTRTFWGMLFARFMAGVTSSVFSTMVGGVVADIYHTKDRNTPMTLFTGSALFGTGLGPLISCFIAQRTTWRWIFYSHTIVVAFLMVLIYFFFRETRGSVLLSRKAKVLNSWYESREAAGYHGVNMTVEGKEGAKQTQRVRWKVKADEERGSLGQMIRISLYRPFHLLFTEPVVFFFSLWISFGWAVLYLTFGAIPYIFTKVYGFDLSQNGAVFSAISIAAVISTFLSIYQDRLANRVGWLPATPEARLYFSCIESDLLPAGLFWLGWSATPSIPWIVPTLAVGCATMGIFSIYLSVFNYLADTYHRYASSAIAAQSFCRNLLGGSTDLYTTQMYEALGIGGASSLLGGVGLILTLVPWVLVFYGPKIRARSKFASEQVPGY